MRSRLRKEQGVRVVERRGKIGKKVVGRKREK